MVVNFANIGCVIGESVKAKQAFEFLQKQFGFIDISQEYQGVQLIIVLGGDGELLRVMHKYMVHKVPFYGLNFGTLGF
mgnify:CR=1 FL=1